MITIIGTGNLQESEGMTVAGFRAIDNADTVIYQSSRQACYKDGAKSLDAVFEQAEDFDEFVKKASEYICGFKGNVVFAAIGDGVNNNVALQLCRDCKDVSIIEGHLCSCISTAVRVGHLPVDNVYYISGYDYPDISVETDKNTVICGIDNELLFWDIKAKLLDYYDGDMQVFINNSVVSLGGAVYSEPCDIFLRKLDILEKKKFSYADLMNIVGELRQKCPWDREQTHKSIRTNLVEECYELYEAIDKEDSSMMLEEMGDVLLQVCLHNIFECEHGDVQEDDVTTLISQKLIRRHPHVYGEAVAETEKEVKSNWDAIKKQEYSLKSKSDELKHISQYLPALMRGYKVIKKAGKLGIEVIGDIDKVIDQLNNGHDIKDNCVRLMLLAIKLILEAGEHPYICLNDGVNAIITKTQELENNKNLSDEMTINLNDMDFY